MRVYYHTFGCKANQYDSESMRQELEARGAATASSWGDADVCVVNTCTVTSRADAEARRVIRKIRRENPDAGIVVAGCSAALRGSEYRRMEGVAGVVGGQDRVAVAGEVERAAAAPGSASGRAPALVQIGLAPTLDRIDQEPVGAEILKRRQGMTRGWLKVQDGCDRKCAFCATRLARGASRSRPPEEVVREARALARRHPELVITGIHIGHYGRDLDAGLTLSRLLARLLDEVPDVRFRLGSIEATEVDELLVELLAGSGGRVAAHLHMPLQSGADPVLRRMRRWHTREAYRARALEIAGRLHVLGLGADIITGFPGETGEDHASTRALVEELPYTYVHVFPFSPREGTVAAELAREDPVPERVAGERSRELRELVADKARRHRAARVGDVADVVVEGDGARGLTGDYLRVRIRGNPEGRLQGLRRAPLQADGDDLYIDLSREVA
ncbi:MAG TPA: MiaB/RimO family radical SAM methylthiotransferase [Longimicrobiales bacterium]|nr:MiaB/RimO family radical SAM methylthiotransferase [Longimicrobiales bacterium]